MWIKCDELHMIEFLTPDDVCYYCLEYFEGGYGACDENQLVFNFKKPITAKGAYYRSKAIEQYAQYLSKLPFHPGCMVVPAYTSNPRSSPQFNDRLDRTVTRFNQLRPEIPYCFGLDAVSSTNPVHESNSSRNPADLIKNISVNIQPNILNGIDTIVIVDDVITTGGHFIAMKMKIHEIYPHIKVNGVFLAHKINSLPPKDNTTYQ